MTSKETYKMNIRIGDIIRTKEKRYVNTHFYEISGVSRDFVVTFPNDVRIDNKSIIGVYRLKNGEMCCVYQKYVSQECGTTKRKDLLKLNDLPKFGEWITRKGWTVEQVKGGYEVFRASSKKRKPIIFYLPQSEKGLKEHTKNGEIYVTVMWEDFKIVEEFYNNINN